MNDAANASEPTIIGQGYDTYEVERGPATGRWNIYRIGAVSDAFIKSERTRAAAVATARKLAGVVA